MEIHRATSDDAAALTQIISMFFDGEGFRTTPEVVAARVPEFLSADGNAAFLAFSGDEVIGVSTVSTSYGLENGRLAEIEDLYVRPAHRGNGVATALLGQAMLWGRAQGFDSLEVVVTPEDGTRRDYLIGWYGRLGFVDTGRLVLHFDGTGGAA